MISPTASDVLTNEQRRFCMSQIRGKDTNPEMFVRRALHAMGFRYQVHARSLPGSPDLAFPRLRAAIFIHGCFWHVHSCPRFFWPRNRKEFWRQKLLNNAKRDRANLAALRSSGWKTLVIWECALRVPMNAAGETVPGECAKWLRSPDWRDAVIGRHSPTLRAVTGSFESVARI